MSLRQQGELLELQNRHLLQRRSLWDRKHNILSNSTLVMIGQSKLCQIFYVKVVLESQSVETEDIQNKLHQVYENNFKPPMPKIREPGQNNFLFSPLGSGNKLTLFSLISQRCSFSNDVLWKRFIDKQFCRDYGLTPQETWKYS